MDALCKCMFIIIETIVNSMKTRHDSKVVGVFQRNLSIKQMKKEIQGSITSLSLHWAIYWHNFWTCKMYIAYIVYYYICLPLCAYILYFDAAKFSIK